MVTSRQESHCQRTLLKVAALPEAQFSVGAQGKLLEHLQGSGSAGSPESTSASYSVLPVEALRPDAAAGARERMEQKHANACNEAF